MPNPELIIRSSLRKKQILEILESEKYMFQSDIARRLGLSVVTTRQHLQELIDLNLIESEHSGKFIFYSLSISGKNLLKRLK